MQFSLGALSSPGPDILHFGPFILRWYGLLIAVSVLIGLNLSNKLARSKGISNGIINDHISTAMI